MENNRAGVSSKDSLGILTRKMVPVEVLGSAGCGSVSAKALFGCRSRALQKNIKHSGVEK